MNRLNYNQYGNTPDGGFPFYANDFARTDKNLAEITQGILNGLFDFSDVKFITRGTQRDTNAVKNYIINGCKPTVISVSGTTYRLSITKGLAMIGSEIVNVASQNITYTYTTGGGNPLQPLVVLTKMENNESRTFKNASTNIAIKDNWGELSNNIGAPGVIILLNNDTADMATLVNNINAFQAWNKVKIAGENDYAVQMNSNWEPNTVFSNDTDKILSLYPTSHIQLEIPFKCLSGTNASSEPKVMMINPTYLPNNNTIDGHYVIPVISKDGSTFKNDTLMYFDESWLCLKKTGTASFSDNEIVYVNTNMGLR